MPIYASTMPIDCMKENRLSRGIRYQISSNTVSTHLCDKYSKLATRLIPYGIMRK
jgi:hypothetical protein